MEIFFLILALLCGAVGAFLCWKLQKQRRKMEQWTRQIEHFMQYSEEVLEDSLEEGALANLNNQIARLEQYLLHQRLRGEQREAQMTRFVENMAHQMKNAVTALQIQLDILQMQIPPDKQKALQKGQANLDRLTGEIDRILKSSQLAEGKISMNLDSTGLYRLILHCGEKLRPLAAYREVNVKMEGDSGIAALVDPFWFSQALENLLKNAIEHTEEGSEVTVILRDEGQKLRIRVTDEGEGIPEEELPELFHRFSRGRSTKAGYGVGLSLARDVILAHHGTLTAGNRCDKGAWFEIALPVLEGTKPYEAEKK